MSQITTNPVPTPDSLRHELAYCVRRADLLRRLIRLAEKAEENARQLQIRPNDREPAL